MRNQAGSAASKTTAKGRASGEPPLKSKKASSSAKSATANAPASVDPWSPKGVAINLSRARREALKAFAESSGSAAAPMTPAQALYSLIDLIGPASADDDDGLASGVFAVADDRIIGCSSRQERDKAGKGVEAFEDAGSGRIEDRLSVIERDVGALAESMSQCASALERLGAAIDPIHALLNRLGLEAERERAEAVAARPSALSLVDWLRSVAPTSLMAAPGATDEIVAALRLIEKRSLTNGEVALTFACRLPAPASGAPSEAAPLALMDKIGGPLALCLELEPSASIVAVFARSAGAGDAWEARVCRRSASGALGPVIYRARASAAARAS